MTHPLPTRLPGLIRTALEHCWVVTVAPRPRVLFAHFTSPSGVQVEIQWVEGRCVHSEIDSTPTPYTQCVALLKTMED